MVSRRDVRPLHQFLGTVFVCSLAAGCGGESAVPDEPEEVVATPKVLVIGIDGVRPDVLADVATPHIDALIEDGVYSAEAQTGLPTVSGPGWSSMLTGVWSDKHGVQDNTFEGKQFEAYPDFLTRIEQVAPELETFAVADWTPLVLEGEGGPLISAQVDEVVTLDGYVWGWAEADSMSVDTAVDRLRRRDLDALFVYLGDPDETSHQTGSIGAEYRASIARADRHVGRLVAALKERPTYGSERWLILSSTDHGRLQDGGHGGESTEERTIYFLASGPDVSRGSLGEPPQIVDVAVTALVHLGIVPEESWNMDGTTVGLRK